MTEDSQDIGFDQMQQPDTPKDKPRKKQQRDIESILEQRARQLARRSTIDRQSIREQSFISFKSISTKFACPLSSVVEIQPSREISIVPCLPSFYLGAVNIRGNIILLVDIARFLALTEHGVTDFSHIIVIKSGNVSRGIIAREINKEELEWTPEHQAVTFPISERNQRFIKGLAPDLTLILDVDAILVDSRMRLLSPEGVFPTD